MSLSRYVVSDTPETWAEAYTEYDSYTEARDAAMEQGGCVTEITYEFSDTELVDDFREPEPANPTDDEED